MYIYIYKYIDKQHVDSEHTPVYKYSNAYMHVHMLAHMTIHTRIDRYIHRHTQQSVNTTFQFVIQLYKEQITYKYMQNIA